MMHSLAILLWKQLQKNHQMFYWSRDIINVAYIAIQNSFFLSLASNYYLAATTCQEVFMSHGFVSRFYYRVRLFNALYIMLWVLSLFKSFISWLFLILRIISLVQFSIHFFHWICVDCLKKQPIDADVYAYMHVQHTLHSYCVYSMHQHQQWFTVKVFGIWNDDDINRIIRGREVIFMFGNAFCNCIVYEYIYGDNTYAFHFFFFHTLAEPNAFCIKTDDSLAGATIWVFMNFIWK